LHEDPLFGPDADWEGGDDVNECPHDPNFSWTYPSELLATDSE
jgi:hypothetical protein